MFVRFCTNIFAIAQGWKMEKIAALDTLAQATADLARKRRRGVLKGLGLGVAGLAASGATKAIAQAVVPAQGVNDVNIQRFGLNFEYLGAELYLRALGSQLPTSMVVGPRGQAAGPVSGARQVNFSSPLVKAYVQQLANDETLHVNFVRNNLGINAVARPTLELFNSFATIAQNAGLGSGFDAYANDANFLLAAYVIEETCVTSLRGAVTLIQSKMVLDGVTGLLGAEAYQAGMLRTALFSMGYANQTQALSYLRVSLAGEAGTPTQGSDHGVGTLTAPTIANVDSLQAIPDERTMTQIMQIAYGSAANPPAPGGFFPQGVNMY